MNIVVCGDFYPTQEKPQMEDLCEVIRGADYSLVNLECPVATAEARPIKKVGPTLCCDESVVDYLTEMGVRCVTLANNHIADYGAECVLSTKSLLEAKGLDVVGVGCNQEQAERFLLKEIAGVRLAIINCCESEFSLATKNTPGANPLNPVRQYYAIQEARSKADYVMVVVHGGHEYYPLPSPRMKETYRFFVDAGADAVVNHHQHCFSGYEVYRGKPIFYGLGNFYFPGDSKSAEWYRGILLKLKLDDGGVAFDYVPYIQCDGDYSVRRLHPSERTEFEEKMSRYVEIIEDDEQLSDCWTKYAEQRKTMLQDAFSPYATYLTIALSKHGLLPKFLQPARLREALSAIRCESHRDVLTYLLEKKTADE